MSSKAPDPSCNPTRELTAGREPDRRAAARLDPTHRTTKRPVARRFRLANSTVVVQETAAGLFARIERACTVEYAVLARETMRALVEVARA